MSGVIGATITLVLVAVLGRLFPPGQKPHSLTWYKRRYEWLDRLCVLSLFAGLGLGLWLYGAGHVRQTDPRGLAVGFAVANLLPLSALFFVCAISPVHRLREYWDFLELKYGVRNVFPLCLVVPAFAASVFGSVHLIVYGP